VAWTGAYLFVAMTPAESDDLKEAARGLIYWGQVPVHVTIGGTEFTTALFPRAAAASCPSRWRSDVSCWSIAEMIVSCRLSTTCVLTTSVGRDCSP
jgi:Domain of unknown function (DUF1905)